MEAQAMCSPVFFFFWITPRCKQKSGRKIRPADQWTHSVFQAQRPWWVTSQKVSREQRGRTDSLHCSGCFVSLGNTDSHKFQTLQVKTPIAMRSSMSPQPVQPTHDCFLAERLGFLFPLNSVSAKGTEAPNSSCPRNIHRCFTSRIIKLTASACQLCVYNSEATKHRGNYLVMNNV